MDENNVLYFGSYPQTVKANDVTIDESNIYNINNWKSYKGSDNCYYVKEEAQNLNSVTDIFYNKLHFSNGEKVISGKDYFYKLEEISWIVLNNYKDNSTLLMSKKGLDVTCFDSHIDKDDKAIVRDIKGKKIIPQDYAYSNIRAFLNGLDGSRYDEKDYTNKGFIDKAFTDKERKRIKEDLIDNCEKSVITTILQDKNLNTWDTSNTFTNTIDKVSLLSFNEASYFDKRFRVIQPSDYAMAKGGFNLGLSKGCWWWLRSPEWNDFIGYENICASYVQDSGDIDMGIRTDLKLCIVPTIVLEEKD